ncbi:hypothetical protein L0U88_01660 [Flavihumibacter sp. RY-1]|uniref:Response regulatory domain-containing protein n=1 Tax=Flavihumibacter fluminis TaxID=2909236 RepID=A0ABS9BE27_9BACT|nr:hypothetical protein [Flavihumibacter fluminis]MCF1713332.1 hypothetical protein [Flavihumibacter fluminis]
MHELLIGLIVTAGGSLLNFISTKIYNSVTGSSKNFIWKNTYPALKSIQTPLEFEELKKRTRIVVIDDEDSFPISLFQAENYSIDKWAAVKDYSKLENGFYDIIVLDIKGVALHISVDDGLGVLESIKRKNPSQIIIAYSQHSFDLSKAKFWELADEKIAKPSDYLKIKNIIDTLIDSKFKPGRYIETLHSILRKNGYDEIEIKKLDKELIKVIKNKQQPDWSNILDFASNKPELVHQIITIGNTLLKFFK